MLQFIIDYQLDIMFALICICGFSAFCVCVTTTLSKRRKISLVLIELTVVFMLVFDRYNYIFMGDSSELGYYMIRISNFVLFFTTIFVLGVFNLYLKDLFYINEEDGKTSKLLLLTDILVAVGIGLLIISQFTDLYYYFDESNNYYRSSVYFISYIFPLLTIIIELIVIIKNRKKISKKICFSLILFIVGPVIASLIQLFVYGLSITSIFVAVLAIVLFLFALMDLNETVSRANEKEIQYLKNSQKSTQRLFEQTATALVNSIDAKDKYTHGHSSRVAEYSRKIAEMSGKSEKECYEVYYAALLHDVGKIGIKDSIINKVGRLDDNEYEQIKRHPEIGQGILSGISEFQYLSIGANYHHERYDGKGYPEKLKGEDIPEIARIVAVADAYDAMSSKRSYRDPIPQQKIREEFVKGSGTQFDPKFAKIMIHLIDLDEEYEMQEKEEIKELSGRRELICKEYRSEISEGILLLENITTIHLNSSPKVSETGVVGMPSIVLFDSLDGRVYTDEKMKKDMNYTEYGEIRFDGKTVLDAARKMKVEEKENADVGKLLNKPNEKGYIIEGVKISDHVLIRIMSPEHTTEITVALPDSTRYCYVGLTGEYCDISDVVINKDDKAVSEDYITRIAEKVSFINGPEGDVPNVQVDGYRTASTIGIPINDGMCVAFHGMSLPTARLVWHTPFIVLFYADDGKVNGVNYREFALIRLDGENWETGGFAENKIIVNKAEAFSGWDEWRAFNRNGFDSTVRFEKKESTVTTYTDNDGIFIKNITKVNGKADIIYMALTGDQVAITNIKLTGAELFERMMAGENINEIHENAIEKVRSSIVKVYRNGKGEDEALAMTERLSATSGLEKKAKLHLRLLAEELMGMVKTVAGDVNAEYYLEVSGRDYELHLNSEIEITPEMKEQLTAKKSRDNSDSKGFMSRLRGMIASVLVSKNENEFSWNMEEYRTEVKRRMDQNDKKSANACDELEKSILANIADDVSVKVNGNNVEIVVYRKF